LPHQFGVVKPFRDLDHWDVWHEYQHQSVCDEQHERDWGQNDSRNQFPFVDFDVFHGSNLAKKKQGIDSPVKMDGPTAKIRVPF
jgi:hypothetical protein